MIEKTFNTSLPKLALYYGNEFDKTSFTNAVKDIAQSCGRVQVFEFTPGRWTLSVNGNTFKFNAKEDGCVFILAFNPNESTDDRITVIDAVTSNEVTLDMQPALMAKFSSTPPALSNEILYFTSTEPSGVGTLRSVYNNAKAGDTIMPDPRLWNDSSNDALIVNYPYSFPIGKGVSIRSGIQGRKVVIDFDLTDVTSTVNTDLGDAVYEDIVFANYAGNGGSYAQVQFANASSGSASFYRCGFYGWIPDADTKTMFRHSSTSNTSTLSFYNCVASLDTNGAGNGWFCSGYCGGVLMSCSFNNNGQTGYPIANVAQWDEVSYNATTVASQAGTNVLMSTFVNDDESTFAIIGTKGNDIDGAPMEGSDYFGNPNDGTIGAISGGLYKDYSSYTNPAGDYLGNVVNIANIDTLKHSFTFNRIDRNITGAYNISKSPLTKVILFGSRNETINDVQVVVANPTFGDATIKNVTENGFTVDIVTAFTSWMSLGGQYNVGTQWSKTGSGAFCVPVSFSSGQDIVAKNVAPKIYYIGTNNQLSVLNKEDWSLVGFDGNPVPAIGTIGDCLGFTFAFNKDVTIDMPLSTYKENTYYQYDGATIRVTVNNVDVTQELKDLGLIKDYSPNDYVEAVFGEDLAQLAVLAWCGGLTNHDERLQIYGEYNA